MTAPRRSSPTGTVSSWSAPSADRDTGPLRSTWRVKSPAASGRLTINRWTDGRLLAVVCLPVTFQRCCVADFSQSGMTQIFFCAMCIACPGLVRHGRRPGDSDGLSRTNARPRPAARVGRDCQHVLELPQFPGGGQHRERHGLRRKRPASG